jgi:hypothetical protein
LQLLVKAGATPVFLLRTKALRPNGGIYISAGIHGDEPGGTEGLIAWAEENLKLLRELPLLILPCLNPWGLLNNCRFAEDGADLNRTFNLETQPVINAVKAAITGYRFELALNLHEDFDGEGFYLYEIQRERPFWGESLLEAAREIMPIESRVRVDGRKATAGLIRRRFEAKKFGEMGFPEAIYLHLHHSRRSITIETPSEFALEQRIRTQVAVIDAAVRLAVGSAATGGKTRRR